MSHDHDHDGMSHLGEMDLRVRALEFANLVTYVDRMMTQYYPEHEWQQLQVAA